MIRVFIADDHTMVREGLKRIIAECKDMLLVGEAEHGQQVLDDCNKICIDVLLLDISMPGPGFLKVLELVIKNFISVRVLVLSVSPEDHYAVRAIKAGASGYLTKNNTPEELAIAIRLVANGKRYLGTHLADQMATALQEGNKIIDLNRLSDREYQILSALGAGKKVGQIANELSLSPKTVSTYRNRILAKLNLVTTGELIRFAVEQKIHE